MTHRLIHLKWVLVDQISDLTTATQAIRNRAKTINSSEPIDAESTAYFRMCTTFSIITLAKLWEALDHYSIEIKDFPPALKEECSSLRKIIEKKKIYQFRSKYAAHIIDKSKKEPISLSEGIRRHHEIAGESLGDILDYCDWIYSENQSSESQSVLSTVIEARDHCLSAVGKCTKRP